MLHEISEPLEQFVILRTNNWFALYMGSMAGTLQFLRSLAAGITGAR